MLLENDCGKRFFGDLRSFKQEKNIRAAGFSWLLFRTCESRARFLLFLARSNRRVEGFSRERLLLWQTKVSDSVLVFIEVFCWPKYNRRTVIRYKYSMEVSHPLGFLSFYWIIIYLPSCFKSKFWKKMQYVLNINWTAHPYIKLPYKKEALSNV